MLVVTSSCFILQLTAVCSWQKSHTDSNLTLTTISHWQPSDTDLIWHWQPSDTNSHLTLTSIWHWQPSDTGKIPQLTAICHWPQSAADINLQRTSIWHRQQSAADSNLTLTAIWRWHQSDSGRNLPLKETCRGQQLATDSNQPFAVDRHAPLTANCSWQLSSAAVAHLNLNVLPLNSLLALSQLFVYLSIDIGVRYAKPPIGQLRFKKPVSISWKGTQEATDGGNFCVQPSNGISNKSHLIHIWPLLQIDVVFLLAHPKHVCTIISKTKELQFATEIKLGKIDLNQ